VLDGILDGGYGRDIEIGKTVVVAIAISNAKQQMTGSKPRRSL